MKFNYFIHASRLNGDDANSIPLLYTFRRHSRRSRELCALTKPGVGAQYRLKNTKMYVVCGQARHETTAKDDKKESDSQEKKVLHSRYSREFGCIKKYLHPSKVSHMTSE